TRVSPLGKSKGTRRLVEAPIGRDAARGRVLDCGFAFAQCCHAPPARASTTRSGHSGSASKTTDAAYRGRRQSKQVARIRGRPTPQEFPCVGGRALRVVLWSAACRFSRSVPPRCYGDPRGIFGWRVG